MSTSKNKNYMTQATISDLVISVPNPRFAGIDYDVLDPKPYGDAIDTMFQSMVETYKKTGSLLLQPVICEYKDNKNIVRAGYTRAITFVTRYNDLCNTLETSELTIPIVIMDGINIVDSLTENVVRTNQHYVTLAYAIAQSLKVKGVNINKIASQFGMSVARVQNLRKIALLDKRAIEMCFNGILTESGALELANFDDAISNMIIDEIIDRDNLESLDKDDIRRLYDFSLPEIAEGVPTDAFTDVDGNEYPAINQESWYVANNDMFNSARTKDIDATTERAQAYWNKFAADNNLKLIDRYNTTGYVRCEMGTHPEEVVAWDYNKLKFSFYVRESAIQNVQADENFVQVKHDTTIDRVNRKIVIMKEQAKKEVLFKHADKIVVDTADLTKAYSHYLKYQAFNKSLQESIYAITCNEISNGAELIKYYGAESAMKIFVFANLLSSYPHNFEGVNAFFKDNNIQVHQELLDMYAVIESKKSEMMDKANDRVEDFSEDVNKKRKFVEQMFYTIVYETGLNLYDSIDNADENLITFICRNIGISNKGSVNLMRTRLKNSVNYILNTLEAEADTKTMLAGRQIYNKFNQHAVYMYEELGDEQLNGTYINEQLNELYESFISLGFIVDTAPVLSYEIKGIIKSAEVNKRIKAQFVAFFSKAKDHLTSNVRFVYANDKNKYNFI
jgi:hypothetical protein